MFMVSEKQGTSLRLSCVRFGCMLFVSDGVARRRSIQRQIVEIKGIVTRESRNFTQNVLLRQTDRQRDDVITSGSIESLLDAEMHG